MRGLALSLFMLARCRALVTPAPTGPAPAVYWPMQAGQNMQFELKMGTQEQTQVVQLTHQEGPWIFDDRGQRFRYDGLGLFDSRRYLIKRPLVVGSQWMSVPQPGVVERFSIAGVARPCAAPHGSIKDCLVVEARQNIDKKRTLLTRWWYGRGLGPLRIDTFIQDSSGRLEPKSSILRALED